MKEFLPLEIYSIDSVDIACVDDGRPSTQEAWEMLPLSEADSVVWTEEMANAWGRALQYFQADNVAAARKAFETAYVSALREARRRGVPVRWIPSLGTDKTRREKILLDALERERLSPEHVQCLLPHGAPSPVTHRILAHLRLKNIS